MDIRDTGSRTRYDRSHYPVSAQQLGDDGRKRWAPLPVKARKDVAVELVEQLLTGNKKAQALAWIRCRRYTPGQLENFIKNMERGLAARKEARAQG